MTESHQEMNFQRQTPDRSGDRWRKILPLIVLAFVTAAVFGPVIGHQFLAYDDSVNVYKNPYLQARSMDNLLHFWRYPYEGLYSPLTYTLWALAAWTPGLLTANPSEVVVPDPRLFHGFNLLLHLLSVLIVWRILVLRLPWPEADLHYTEAIRLNPHYKNAHLRLSTVLAAQGEFDRARYNVSEVLRMDPDHKTARQIRERIEYLDRSSKTQ